MLCIQVLSLLLTSTCPSTAVLETAVAVVHPECVARNELEWVKFRKATSKPFIALGLSDQGMQRRARELLQMQKVDTWQHVRATRLVTARLLPNSVKLLREASGYRFVEFFADAGSSDVHEVGVVRETRLGPQLEVIRGTRPLQARQAPDCDYERGLEAVLTGERARGFRLLAPAAAWSPTMREAIGQRFIEAYNMDPELRRASQPLQLRDGEKIDVLATPHRSSRVLDSVVGSSQHRPLTSLTTWAPRPDVLLPLATNGAFEVVFAVERLTIGFVATGVEGVPVEVKRRGSRRAQLLDVGATSIRTHRREDSLDASANK